MDNTGIGTIVKIQSVSIQTVQKHSLFQHQVFTGPDSPEASFFRLSKIKVL